jgi:hypothetical protein
MRSRRRGAEADLRRRAQMRRSACVRPPEKV